MDEKTDDISLSHHDKEILKDQQSTSTVINEDLEKSSSTFQGPPDGGWEAWLVVFGGFLVNINTRTMQIILSLTLFLLIGQCLYVMCIVYEIER